MQNKDNKGVWDLCLHVWRQGGGMCAEMLSELRMDQELRAQIA